MNEKMIQWSRGILESVELAVNRIQNNTLSDKDRFATISMISELQNAVSKESGFNSAKDNMLYTMYNHLGDIRTSLNLDDNNSDILSSCAIIGDMLPEFEKLNHISNALKFDSKTMSLEEEIRQRKEEIKVSFQKAIDIDVQVSGKVSDITIQALEAFHFMIDETGKVVPHQEAIRVPQEQVKPIKVKLNIPPQLSAEEKRNIERQLYAAGARYDKYFIPQNKSYDGKEYSGRNWYVWKMPDTDMKPFEKILDSVKVKTSKNVKDSILSRLDQKGNIAEAKDPGLKTNSKYER